MVTKERKIFQFSIPDSNPVMENELCEKAVLEVVTESAFADCYFWV